MHVMRTYHSKYMGIEKPVDDTSINMYNTMHTPTFMGTNVYVCMYVLCIEEK